jgi:general nucleoside transport system permease protein
MTLLRRIVSIGFSVVFVAAFAYLLTVHVLARGIVGAESFEAAQKFPFFTSVLGINVLIGVSLVLFVGQIGRESLRVVLTVAGALLIGFGITLLISSDPVNAFNALLTGPVSRINRWAGWVTDAMALILLGLAITLVFRARLFSLGAEGQIYFGALAAGLVALFVPGLPIQLHIPLALGAAMLAGMAWGAIPGALRAGVGANELVSTLMLNPIAAAIFALILEELKPEGAGFLVSADFPDTALLPKLITGTDVTTGIFLVVGAVILVWVLLQRTPLGYEIRMVGENIRFARYGGIKTRRVMFLAMSLSGAVAGLVGGYLVMALFEKLQLGLATGLAFEGIVVALLARNNPLAVPAMALMYSYLRVGGPIMQTDADVSQEIVRVIQAIIILLFTAEGILSFIKVRRKRERIDIIPADPNIGSTNTPSVAMGSEATR